MKLVFIGSGAFGIPSLQALSASDEHALALVVSQPDRPAGRKKILTPPPLAQEASRLGLPLFQPERINREATREWLAAEEADAFVVIAYGQILRPAVLEIPELGCLNVHGSLLPRHRGASPIQAAILAGDAVTGVTVMQMDAGMDTGPMLTRRETAIHAGETAGALHDRLAALAPEPLLEALAGRASRSLQPVPQDDAQATTCSLIRKEDGALDWSEGADALQRRVRAMTPWPGAHAWLPLEGGRALRAVIEVSEVASGGGAPGAVLVAEGAEFRIAAGDGSLRILRLRPAGKASLSAAGFLRGYRVVPGAPCADPA